MSGSEHPPPRLAVGVIGMGRVGAPLAVALARAGHPVVGVHAVSARSRRRAEEYLPNAPVRSIAEIMTTADLVLVTVPDDVLSDLVTGLAKTEAMTPGQFVVHTSGRYGISVLEPVARLGALPLALHPVMTFAGTRADLDRLNGCPFGVTAPAVLRAVAEALVVEMGGEPIWVAEEARPIYHAALANGANHLVTLVAQTLDLLGGAGIADPATLVRPLLTAALDNVLRMGDEALTGPVARGDAGTVATHLEVLSQHSPEARAAYVAMARLTADRALAAGLLDPEAAEALLDVLGVAPSRWGTADVFLTRGTRVLPRDAGMSSVLRVVRTRESLKAAYAEIPQPAIRSARATRAAVFTMGALHEGHRALIRAARGEVGPTGHVTVTIFVNPLQFAAGEDLQRYPRDLKADAELCADEDVDLVFAPAEEVLYPDGEPQVRIDPGPLGEVLEGAARPGHFSGMLTVVLKLLHLTLPHATFFGEKDYQQLTLVRRMVADLDLDAKVHPVPTLREPDGLARSSRNQYLSAEERSLAVGIPTALAAGVTAADLGRPTEAIVGAAEVELARVGLTPDYVALTGEDLGPAPATGPARLLVACPVGATRLIDNTPVVLRR